MMIMSLKLIATLNGRQATPGYVAKTKKTFGKNQLRSDMKIIRLVLTLMPAFVFVVGSVGCTTAPPAAQTGSDAEVSFDGLHKYDNTRVDVAWAAPNFDLSSYTKIMPVSVSIEYRVVKNRGSTASVRSQGGPYFIDDRARADFEALANKIFMEELQKSNRFYVVDEPGPDTLIVAGGLLDVISLVPPDLVGGRSRVYLSSVGEATLIVEVRDSETNTILARAADRRAAETLGGSFTQSNSVTNTGEVRRLLRYWGSLVREALEGFTR